MPAKKTTKTKVKPTKSVAKSRKPAANSKTRKTTATKKKVVRARIKPGLSKAVGCAASCESTHVSAAFTTAGLDKLVKAAKADVPPATFEPVPADPNDPIFKVEAPKIEVKATVEVIADLKTDCADDGQDCCRGQS